MAGCGQRCLYSTVATQFSICKEVHLHRFPPPSSPDTRPGL